MILGGGKISFIHHKSPQKQVGEIERGNEEDPFPTITHAHTDICRK